MVNERELAVIKALTEAKGPSGFEDEAVAAAVVEKAFVKNLKTKKVIL